ncbi:MAG: carbon-nitrogen hydrolase family protein [Planctomycetota bacterium]
MNIKIAAAQIDVTIADPAANLQRMESTFRECCRQGAHLTIFPECALAGYCFNSAAEALEWAETLPGPSVEHFTRVARQTGGYVAYGLLERDGEQLYNACALVGPEGLVGSYRKVHLPYLGVDRYTSTGNRGFQVWDAGGLKVGMLICYDLAFPEAARVLALAGADLIALPTNWPPGAQCTSECVANARALENAVFVAAVNRVGQERGWEFIGRSRICDTNGHTLAFAPTAEPTILYSDLNLDRARNKHIVRVPKLHEINRFADRHPEFYGPLVEPVRHQRPVIEP